jgi:16S rRNA (uracil1498-N3)-methyltransferase
MSVFYAPDIVTGRATLSSDESAHCLRVLRLKAGDEVEVIDGRGGYFKAVILDENPKGCLLGIREVLSTAPARTGRIHIAIAPTKNMDRLEWFVEKAVEIGIDEITPLLCKRSERRVLKTDRLEKLVISTMKQAIVAMKPLLHELTPFEDLLRKTGGTEAGLFIAHCAENRMGLLQHLYQKGRDATVLIGPEGDFTPEEINQAMNAGYIPVSLGGNRLRTETAGLVACHTLLLLQTQL